MYFLVIFVFAVAYRLVHDSCNLGVKTMMQAWIFSLETIMTIGYGAPKGDIFFQDCGSMAILLTIESFAGIFLDSICIGIFFARLSRAQARASTIIFSEFAVIRKIRGKYYLMLQVCERRKHQLVEAHVRSYAIRHEYSSTTGETMALFQTHTMRLQQPDDDMGSYLLMAFPQVIVHRIDQWSPLFPAACLPNDAYDPSTSCAFPDPTLRAIDVENGSREQLKTTSSKPRSPTKEEIQYHLMQSELEILVVLEGIDGPTSATMQARHSYTRDDIRYDHGFVPCVGRNEIGGALIDFDKFHLLRPVAPDEQHVVEASMF